MPGPKIQPGANPGHENDALALERLIFFSDAVFAIAITLLALEIRLPANGADLSNAALARALVELWPRYLAYAISFLVIGFFWASHHRKFRLIRRFDHGLLLLNLLLLMVIAFTPFPAAVISENGNRTATIFYALVMILAGLFSAAVWAYAEYGGRLIDPRASGSRRRRRELWTPLAMAGIFLLSIGLAFINEDLAKTSWVLVGVVGLVLRE